MYKKKIRKNVPVALNKKIGFDLKNGDWVIPYGKGIINDFFITLQGDKTKDKNLIIEFSNKYDGIVEYPFKFSSSMYQGCQLLLPHNAPINGYKSKIVINKNERKNDKYTDEEMNYIFRLRTKVDEDGNIISAKYGEIHGDIKFRCRAYHWECFIKIFYKVNKIINFN